MFSDNNFKAIIVEDEKASQEYLADVLTKYFPQIRLVCIEDTVQQAIDAINRHQPDMVFMDVEIKMGTGFDVLAGVSYLSFNVIFTTAFNKFAVDAFQYNAVDYLLKPLEHEKTIRAIQRSIERVGMQRSSEGISQLLQYLKQPPVQQKIPISTMYGIDFIDVENIMFVEAEGNYSCLKLRSGENITTTKKIKEIEDQLPGSIFIRIHNSYLVNMNFVKKYFKGRGGYIILDNGASLPISPSRKNDFLRLFDAKA